LEKSHGFQRVLHNFGMELEVVTAAPHSPAVNDPGRYADQLPILT
jgi:hypothetical protein